MTAGRRVPAEGVTDAGSATVPGAAARCLAPIAGASSEASVPVPGVAAGRPGPVPGAPPGRCAPTPDGPVWRPSLARGVVLRRDRVREADLLLLPERVVVLHGRAGRVLGLCDGSRTTDDIVAELSADFPGAPVAYQVPDFICRLREEGWLT
ncbi:pyrroloquinoline quinone biosynthesis protein D [Streptomyces griseochromogenes]|uniref:Pyrroloquinoline quinone biosynthesis protein D n=1 Tax=Streptomyces griseochromogenes TaxID=68214 RepID=A0ABS4LW04_9ACTN|nr:pyrroloquinoline quinone biosynthesis peptide chaperone PqqD [Streptomyces griseochromogenes]MBP2051407.1 pyrroloquinoline quinone biosynthesis protein D [Streptomyces griseochromogenes]